MLVLYAGGELIGEGVVDCGGGVGGEDMYKGKAEPVLASVSDLYSDDDSILGT